MAKKTDGTPIIWPLSTSPGIKPQEDSGRLINCYAEPIGENSGAIYHRAPGVTAYGSQSATALGWTYWTPFEPFFATGQVVPLPTGVYRGGIFVNNVLYGVFGEFFWTIVQGGASTKIGAVSGTDKVFFARNNKAPTPDIVLVCQAGTFVVTTTTISAYPDINVGSPTCVVGIYGFFIFGYGNGNLLSTNVNVTTINTLNLANANSDPDGVIQLVSYNGYLYVMGNSTIETWGPPINPTGFPLSRQGFNMTPGLINHHAIAGFEPEFGQPPLYVASDYTVRQLQTSQPIDVSPPQLQRLIKGATADLEALVYVSDGVPFFQISNDEFTWVLCLEPDIGKSRWHERKSYLSTRSRLTGSVFAFNTWLCGDTLAQGRMLEIDSTVYKEVDQPFIPEIESLPVEDFPAFVTVYRADFEFTTGVGIIDGHDPDQTNPYAEVSWSNDGGITWSNPRFRELGRQQKSLRRITVRRTGMSGPQGRRWRLAVPSAVHFGLVGGGSNMTAFFTEK